MRQVEDNSIRVRMKRENNIFFHRSVLFQEKVSLKIYQIYIYIYEFNFRLDTIVDRQNIEINM